MADFSKGSKLEKIHFYLVGFHFNSISKFWKSIRLMKTDYRIVYLLTCLSVYVFKSHTWRFHRSVHITGEDSPHQIKTVD